MPSSCEMDADDEPIRMKDDQETAKFPPQETARMFFRHLLDNTGQFQQLYDGLFRWKMNDDPALPSFNAIRPYLVHLLLATETRAKAGETILNSARRNTMNSDDGASDLPTCQMNSIGYSSFEDDTSTPFETAFTETDSDHDNHFVPYVGANDSGDEFSNRDSHGFYDNVSACRNSWLDEPVDVLALEADFDFENNLSSFKKIPLSGETAVAASSNAAKQKKVIERLLRRVESKKRVRPTDREEAMSNPIYVQNLQS